ncbi:MAG TPA: HAD-IIA family hydrolase [Streptosporangiaceae bacterium]|nr:HAD-IIA family hydrolase [Streptosporangiaceae bacterium]
MSNKAHNRVGVTADAGPLTSPGGRPLAAEYDVALLDLDGVVYAGQQAIPGAPAALARAREAGLRLAFVTNNASRSPSAIAEHLSRLGVAAASSDVVTSAQAAATLIAEKFPAGSPVLVAGSNGLRLALRERGMRPVSVAADRPVAVVQGFAPGITYELLAEAGVAVRDGAFYVATNSDSTLPTPRGPQPGNGSLLSVIITATGVRPVVAGKPQTPLHAEAVARTGAERPLVVGDRLDTDIEGAVRGGADSLLVLTGVSTAQDAVLARAGQRPTYLSADLGGLTEPQPVVGPRGSGGTHGEGAAASRGFRFGGWQAAQPGGTGPIELTGGGAWIDGLRALCAAAWAVGDVTEDIVVPPLKTLGDPR